MVYCKCRRRRQSVIELPWKRRLRLKQAGLRMVRLWATNISPWAVPEAQK